MALYIKGMRLPNKTFYSGVDNGIVTAEGNFWSNSKEFGYMVRHDAIEVPPHGRLIEAEPLIKFITDGLNNGEFGYDQIKVLAEIQYAPTIIEADYDELTEDKEHDA